MQDNASQKEEMYAGFFIRTAAFLLDLLIVNLVLLPVRLMAMGVSLLIGGSFMAAPILFHYGIVDISCYLLTVTYFILTTYFAGQTLGKRAFEICVVSKEGHAPDIMNVIYRETIGRFLSSLMFIGYFMILVEAEKKSLHDYLCDTRVVYRFRSRSLQPETKAEPEAEPEAEPGAEPGAEPELEPKAEPEAVEEKVPSEIVYRRILGDEICRELFHGFIRHQEVTKCWRREEDQWVIKDAPFVDDWTEEDYEILTDCLKRTAEGGGFLCGAFYEQALKGFVSVEPELFGGEHGYLDLSSLHVSEDMRGHKIGTRLFEEARGWAEEQGARKLYISAHSAVESQAFYRAMGCVEAEVCQQKHVEAEPFDCQLEYRLPDKEQPDFLTDKTDRKCGE